jgi:hypothetical protein
MLAGYELRGYVSALTRHDSRAAVAEPEHRHIPGEKVTHLVAGQAVFWNGNLIHRPSLKKDVERLTLACNWFPFRGDEPKQKLRARGFWKLTDEYREGLPATMRPCYDRWRALQQPEGR